jgi:hypothetical protein
MNELAQGEIKMMNNEYNVNEDEVLEVNGWYDEDGGFHSDEEIDWNDEDWGDDSYDENEYEDDDDALDAMDESMDGEDYDWE